MSKQTVSAFKKVVGEENFSADVFECIVHSIDGARLLSGYELEDKGKIPIAVVQPVNAKMVSEILKIANRQKTPVVVRSAGTNQIFGTIPQKKGSIVLDLSKMNWKHLCQKDGYVEVGPGVIWDELNEFLAPHGYEFPIFPGSHRIASVGGGISINTSGHVVDSYQGKPGDYVLGLEVVLPTGEIIHTGGKSLRKHAGPDLTRLFIGGEGHFGVITELRLRLLPKPLEKRWAWIIFDSLETLVKAAVRMYNERVPYPRLLEFLDEGYTEIAVKAMGIKAPVGAVLMVTTDGEAPGEAEYKLKKILETCKKEKPLEIQVLESESQWNDLWAAREIPRSVMRGKNWTADTFDPPLTKAVSAFMGMRHFMEKFAAQHEGTKSYLYGHIGGPSMHTLIVFPPKWDDEQLKRVRMKLTKEFMKLSLKYEMTPGENGIFPLRREWFIKAYGRTCYNLLKRTKKVFDPNDILSPGRM